MSVRGVGYQVNKFEQVSSDDHDISLAGVLRTSGGDTPYHVTYPMMHMMLPTPPRQTATREDITSPNYCCGR